MSTLQAQLAALPSTNSATSTTLGFTQPDSHPTAHDDRTGRGIHYSVQPGGTSNATATSTTTTNKKYQPTLLYDTTRIAADVPLSTLQQQCAQAVQQLTTTTTNRRITGSHYLTSVGAMRHDDFSSSFRSQILLLLSSLLSECGADASSDSSVAPPPPQQHEYYLPSLYILEYLLRQYQIHRQDPQDLLWCLLPVAHTFPILFHRCLLLGDWTSSGSASQYHQSYLWLRPYCVEKTDATIPQQAAPIPSRQLVAVSTMKHVDILRHVCRIVRNIKSLYLQELQQQQQVSWNGTSQEEDDDDDDGDVSLSMGLSHILSYTAAIVVEGLHYLQKNHYSKDNSSSASLLENVVRTLLPTICFMIRPTTSGSNGPMVDIPEEIYSWGFMVATTMVETMESFLSTHVRDTLCHAIISACCYSRPNIMNRNDHPNYDSGSIRQNGCLCLFSILFPNGTTNRVGENIDMDCDELSLIPVVESNVMENNSITKYIGCVSFNAFVYNALMEQKNVDVVLPNIISDLLSSSLSSRHENNKVILITASFICAIIATFVHQLSNDESTADPRREKEYTKTPTNTAVAMQLIVSLLENANLRHLLWRDVRLNLISSITAFVLRVAESNDTPNEPISGENRGETNGDTFTLCRTLLLTLYKCDSVQTERGVAYSILRQNKNTTLKSNAHKIDRQYQYATMKHLLCDIVHIGNDRDDGDSLLINDAANGNAGQITGQLDLLLSPNVAIEHPDPMIRLRATEQYKVMIESKQSDSSKHFVRLLRQIASDASSKVQFAIGTMIVTWCEKNHLADLDLVTEGNAAEVMELLLFALCHFSAKNSLIATDEEATLQLQNMITILVHVARIVGQFGQAEHLQLWQVSLECLVGITGKSYNATIVQHVAFSIPILLGDDEASSSIHGSVLSKVIDCEPFMNRLLQRENVMINVKENDEIRQLIVELRRKCEFKVIEALLGTLRDDTALKTTEWMEQRKMNADRSLVLCMNQFRKCTGDEILANEDVDAINACLVASWKILLPDLDAERIPILLTDIASTESIQLWSCMADSKFLSLITNIHNRSGEAVSPYTVVFESIMRLHNDTTTTSFIARKRMLSKAKKMTTTSKTMKAYELWTAAIPALSLLQSGDRGIRIAAANLLKEIDRVTDASSSKDQKSTTKLTNLDVTLLKEICRHIPNAKSHAKLDEQDFLPTFLAKCIHDSSNASALHEKILTQCFYAAVSCGNIPTSRLPGIDKFRWLPLEHSVGGSLAATILLDVTESAGEAAFPLISRWKLVGKKLINVFFGSDGHKDNPTSHCSHLAELAKRCGIMIKGVTVTDPVMIVSTGPISSRQGKCGRARSYSVGKMDGISLITPYPADMIEALVGVLSHAKDSNALKFIANEVLQPSLSSTTWGEYVFRAMDESNRLAVVTKIIDHMTSDNAYTLPIGAQLSAHDISAIFEQQINLNPNQDTILVEYIRNNIERLVRDKDVIRLTNNVFELLKNYSSKELEKNIEGIQLLIQDALVTLGGLLHLLVDSDDRSDISDAVVCSWIDVLLHLLGHETPSKRNVEITYRSRSLVLSILTNLCSHFPKQVAPSLIQAPVRIILTCPANQSIAQTSFQAFSKVVPAFIQHTTDAGLSLTDFLYHVASSIKDLESAQQAIVYDQFSKALSSYSAVATVQLSQKCHGCIGALQAFYLAYEAKNAITRDDAEMDQINFAVDLLKYSSEEDQLSSLLLLLNYSIGLLSLFHDDAQQQGLRLTDKLLPTYLDIAFVASTGSKLTKATKGTKQLCLKKELGRKLVRSTTVRILRVFNDGLMLDSISESIEKGTGEVSKLSLLLWQDLLLFQSLTHIAPKEDYGDDDSIRFREGIANLVTESREFLQCKLPSHIFLASVTALIQEGGTADIRSHALRLLTERVLAVEPTSSEALLYIEILPNINEVVHADVFAKATDHADLVLIQSAMYSIDHITRHLYIPLSTNGSKLLKVHHLLDSLRHCSRILLDCSNRTTDMQQMAAITGDLVSTTALCCGTLVRAVGVQSLSILPNLMKALTSLLKVTNIATVSVSNESLDVSKSIAKAKVTQLSTLRCLLAVIETIPQFLPPYLSDLLTSSAILCNSLRSTSNETALSVQVAETTDKVSSALSKNVAARIIIPAASKALQKSTLCSEIQMLICIIETAVDAATTAMVVAHKDDVLLAMTKALEFEGTWEEYSALVATACNLLSAMIMKVSEIELRRIYLSLRKWCGDITDPNTNAQRRYGFWALSSRLGKELRIIFLPCLDTVTDDIITELKIAVTILCPQQPKRTSKMTKPSKKQKVDHATLTSSSPPSTMSMRILQPLLALLEHSLRADAFQGGQWTRGDSNQKFEQLLDPIGKLLFSQIPSDFPMPEHITDPYRYVIEGEGNVNNEMDSTVSTAASGSVVGCLSALALVGGNEQLWKPLNQVVMEACSNDDDNRSEVRRAGLTCLLELIKSLGDEYIILLPENLPLLSELLEDTNEDVSRLARDVVTQAEELLGESLEDSFR